MNKDILLATINAKWIHPSLALRLLKANLGEYEDRCEIIEFALRQPLREKTEPVLAARRRILGISVSIWNHGATAELLRGLFARWLPGQRPLIVLGGPEVSHLPDTAELFTFADFVIRGEGEAAFRELCGRVLGGSQPESPPAPRFVNIHASPVDVSGIKSGYRLYTDEDLQKKLTYVEAGRGCPFNCEFCLSAVKAAPKSGGESCAVREFPLDTFLAEMDGLVRRGARTFKFLDRTFNLNIERARRIMEFFLEKIAERRRADPRRDVPLTVHFEMVPSRFPAELRETLARFPAGTLRLEIGIQTLNREVSHRIGRPSNPEQELDVIRALMRNTNAIIHADLIAGLPGEDIASFGRGFDMLWGALSPAQAGRRTADARQRAEIQLGILKLLHGAPIARHREAFGMRYSPLPPYEVIETAALPAAELERVKNFARFWELIVNRGLCDVDSDVAGDADSAAVFERFMAAADSLLLRFGRNWGIDKSELRAAVRGAIL